MSHLPVVGSADSPSAAHTDPYQLCIAVAPNCQSNALSHLWKMIMMEETERDKACLPRGSNHLILLPWCIGFVCACGFVSTLIDGKREKEESMEKDTE